MHHILVVDDEPLIVRGVCNILSELEQTHIRYAHSPREARRIAEESRIDILITDVRMPGMSGLDLALHVRELWPRCKVIFLSGHADFEYLQFALRHGAFDYLMKPSDRETLLGLLRKAMDCIAEEISERAVMDRTRQQVKDARPLLIEMYMRKLLSGDADALGELPEQLAMLDIPLRSGGPLVLLVGRIDSWPMHLAPKDRLLLEYAACNIMEEYLQSFSRIVSIKDGKSFVWLVQSVSDDEESARHHLYIREMLEKIQQSVRQLLRLPMSIVLSSPAVAWDALAYEYRAMCGLLQQGIGLDEEIIISGVAKQETEDQDKPGGEYDYIEDTVAKLRLQLETREREAFGRTLSALFEWGQKTMFVGYSVQLELFSSVSAMLLGFMNKRKLAQTVGQSFELTSLSSYHAHDTWGDLLDFYLRLGDALFDRIEEERTDQKREIVDKLDRYVLENLDKDLSLPRLADIVHLSPHYLSRIYHRVKGYPLADYIADLKVGTAKRLLASQDMKAQDVGRMIGFEDMSYFGRFFKKHAGMTPGEYKEAAKSGRLAISSE
ncbi:response regulator transcription factor [Paenibacillus agaridevorans]|uniref:response regulator transcription factor n=1 Tax=Paenibacillus agaridevorans TaxID=171404 RepID=UPI001BE424F4|nr:response regulator [Paenibacillus agaridevorans]